MQCEVAIVSPVHVSFACLFVCLLACLLAFVVQANGCYLWSSPFSAPVFFVVICYCCCCVLFCFQKVSMARDITCREWTQWTVISTISPCFVVRAQTWRSHPLPWVSGKTVPAFSGACQPLSEPADGWARGGGEREKSCTGRGKLNAMLDVLSCSSYWQFNLMSRKL